MFVHKAQYWLMVVVAGALSCTETNPSSCLTTPSVCRAGTQCVKGTDTSGRVWSACVPIDGGGEQGGDDTGVSVGTPDAPAADAPSKADAEPGVDLAAPQRLDASGDVALCGEGTTRSCALDGLLGNCAKGIETCTGGKWGACSVSSQAADRCDVVGDDANCNGKPNEGCPCVTGDKQPCGPSAEQGICKRGTQTCTNTQWGACQGAVFAKARDCTSAMDNDCDGKPDNSVDGVCQCNPTNGTQACDSHPQDGTGSCHAGTQTCLAGTNNSSTHWGPCSGSVGPAKADTCVPGNDANCNGTPNEDCKALGQTCSASGDCLSNHCVQGTCCSTACPASSPSTCGNDGTCDNTGACRKYSNGTVCAAAACTDRNNSQEISTCQAGTCKTAKRCDYHGCDSNSRCTNICPPATIDTGTACQPCGDESQRCCDGASCNAPTLGCVQNTAGDGIFYCLQCGAIGKYCCPTGQACRQGECLSNHVSGMFCQYCGQLDQECCPNMQCSQGTCSPKPPVGYLYCQ